MRRIILILGLIAVMGFTACSKQSAKEPEKQQESQAESAATSESTPPTSAQGAATPEQKSPDSSPPVAEAPTPPPAEPDAAAQPAAPMPSEATAPKPAVPKPLVIPAGTVISVRLGEGLSSSDSQNGQSFSGTTLNPISVSGKTVIPASSPVEGTVVSAKKKGKIKGEGELDLALTGITAKGHRYPVKTAVFSSTQKGKGKRTVATTGGGALVGGLIGGGKGAAIGATAGLAGGALTGNKQVELPAESTVSFKLTAPITLK